VARHIAACHIAARHIAACHIAASYIAAIRRRAERGLTRLLHALPASSLGALARALALASWFAQPRARARMVEAFGLALGTHQAELRAHLLRESLRHATLDRLVLRHARSPMFRAAERSLRALAGAAAPGVSRRVLYLSAALGWPRLLGALAMRAGLDLAWLEDPPRADALRRGDGAQRPRHACPEKQGPEKQGPEHVGLEHVWLESLGRTCCVRTRRVERALQQGREIRVLLLLPGLDDEPQAWRSPDLATGGAAGAAPVLQAALDVVAVLVRACPERVDWRTPRWSLRPTPELAGYPTWSRWAAPSGARRRRAART
jgi:hypothetical protein